MTNHLHFFVQVGEAPLGALMRDVASNYARAYQLKLETTGHLFERRYHAKIVDVDAYLFAVLRYIHLNPVEAGLARSPAQYPWSSHRAYAGLAAPEPWLEIDFCLAAFARERRQAQHAYRRLIQEPAPASDREALETEADVLGDDEFVAKLELAPNKPRASGETIDQVVSEACRRFGVQEAVVRSKSREPGAVRTRAWIARQAIDRGIATLAEVARGLGRDRATLRHAMRTHAGPLDDEDA
jgi:putative transposase